MAEAKWKDTGSLANIQPDNDVQDCNVVPNKDSDGADENMLGKTDDRWFGVNAHEGNFELEDTTGKKYFTVSTPNGAAMVRVVGDGDRVFLGFDVVSSTTQGARIQMQQTETAGAIPVASFKQLDDDEPFIGFDGTSASSQQKSISTANGTGAVDGPMRKAGMDLMGWRFANVMARVEINGSDYWLPLFIPDQLVR